MPLTEEQLAAFEQSPQAREMYYRSALKDHQVAAAAIAGLHQVWKDRGMWTMGIAIDGQGCQLDLSSSTGTPGFLLTEFVLQWMLGMSHRTRHVVDVMGARWPALKLLPPAP